MVTLAVEPDRTFSDYRREWSEAAISQVRRFDRIVTQRVGALNDRFLARKRPLGEARLLWEIGVQGRDMRSLRTQLGLDSGYVSRLLRSLKSAGLVVVGTDDSDRRVSDRAARISLGSVRTSRAG